VLGYLPRDGRIYVCDKDVAVTSFALSLGVIEYQTLVLRGDLDAANEMLPDIPEDQKNKIARFLEGQGYKDQALEIATDSEHRFELALGLGQLKIALKLAREADVEHKWKIVGDAALTAWDLALAVECFKHARDFSSLLLLYTSSADTSGLRELATQAKDAGLHNIVFTALWQLSDVDGCIDLLLDTHRVAEAVLFAQTYKPSRCPSVVAQWKRELDSAGKGKVARLLGMPGEDDMFPEWDESLRLEKEGHGQQSLIDVTEDEAPASPEEEQKEEEEDETAEEPPAEAEAETNEA
jgi:coatomer subunit beta'